MGHFLHCNEKKKLVCFMEFAVFLRCFVHYSVYFPENIKELNTIKLFLVLLIKHFARLGDTFKFH